jgi:hypothetical protein
VSPHLLGAAEPWEVRFGRVGIRLVVLEQRALDGRTKRRVPVAELARECEARFLRGRAGPARSSGTPDVDPSRIVPRQYRPERTRTPTTGSL